MQQREGLPVPQDEPPRLVGPHGEGDPLRRHHEQQPRRQPWSDFYNWSDDLATSSCIAALIKYVCATDFYNWNRVKIRYCDGASFAGEGFDKAQQTDHLPYNFSVLLLVDFSALKFFVYHVVVFLIWWS